LNRLGVLWAVLGLFLGGCSWRPPDCARTEVFCAALVTGTGGLEDHGLAQFAWEAIEQARAQGVVDQAAYVESRDARDYGKNLEWFAAESYDVIVSAGTALREDTLLAAGRHPELLFVGLDQPAQESQPNLISVNFAEDQAGFLAGALAAMVTETGVIGAVCETSEIASNWRACEGFRLGARHQDPEVVALIAFRDSGSQELLFRDADWAQAAGLDLIRDGADVIFGVGGGTGEGALIAAAEAGVYAIGSERDQFHVTRAAQAQLLTSILEDPGPVLYELLELLGTGGEHAQGYIGVPSLAPRHDPASGLPEPIEAQLQGLMDQLAQQELLTGVESERPD
jgi:basic membrane protein A